jgi:dihydroorotase
MDKMELSYLAVFPDGIKPTRIVVDSDKGTIESINPASSIQNDSLLLFPGFIDIHVHAREFPRPDATNISLVEKWKNACLKETFETAGKAAINGGVTCFAAMPNDPIPPDNELRFRRKSLIAKSSECPVVLFASITMTSEPWANLPYKVYLDTHSSPSGFSSWSDLEDVLKRYRGHRVFFHAEDPSVLTNYTGLKEHWKRRPPDAEFSAVKRILELTHKFGLISHICHLSTKSSVEAVSSYNKHATIKVTTEVTPHHLFFSVDDKGYSANGERIEIEPYTLNCNPPIRSEEDRRYLVDALRSAEIQVLASDHAPHLLSEKIAGAPGMPHLDTLGPFVGWLIHDCDFSHQRIAQILSSEPVRIMEPDLDPKTGSIQVGFRASFSVLDLNKKTSIRGKNNPAGNLKLFTRCGWSPFQNINLPAYVNKTIINGISFDHCLKFDRTFSAQSLE